MSDYVIYTDQEVAEIFSTIPDEVKKTMRVKYSTQKSAAKRADSPRAPTKMSFEQWAAIWWDSGKWEQRGNTKDKPFMMCRKDDQGCYEMGNVRIDTSQSNHEDAYEKHSAANRLRCAKPIEGTNKKTGEVRVWNSLHDASRALNCSHVGISLAANSIRRSAAGYFWKYL